MARNFCNFVLSMYEICTSYFYKVRNSLTIRIPIEIHIILIIFLSEFFLLLSFSSTLSLRLYFVRLHNNNYCGLCTDIHFFVGKSIRVFRALFQHNLWNNFPFFSVLMFISIAQHFFFCHSTKDLIILVMRYQIRCTKWCTRDKNGLQNCWNQRNERWKTKEFYWMIKTEIIMIVKRVSNWKESVLEEKVRERVRWMRERRCSPLLILPRKVKSTLF